MRFVGFVLPILSILCILLNALSWPGAAVPSVLPILSNLPIL